MASLDEIEARKSKAEEVWELTTPGRVTLEVTNHLGRPRHLSVQGRNSRLRISQLDRELSEEKMRIEANNPFRNGTLVRVGGGDSEVLNELSDEALRNFLTSAGDEEFVAFLGELTEVNLRRLQGFAGEPELKVTVAKSDAINQAIETRFNIGGTVPSWEELQRSPIT